LVAKILYLLSVLSSFRPSVGVGFSGKFNGYQLRNFSLTNIQGGSFRCWLWWLLVIYLCP
jgi:hypothetical protein